MANVCGVPLHVCRVRATRLDADGGVAAGPNNFYVTDTPLVVTVTPRVEAGSDLTAKSGCDCIVAAYLGPDLLKGVDLEFSKRKVEPGLEEILTGGTIITDGADLVGTWLPGPGECAEPQAAAAFEFWTDVWVGNTQSTVRPYIHYVYPHTTWVPSATTFQNEFGEPGLTGKGVSNGQWANGPYGDQPEPVPADSPGGGFYTDEALPEAACGYDAVTPAS